MAVSKKSYVCNIFKNDISVICVTNIARGKNVWHKNIIHEGGLLRFPTQLDIVDRWSQGFLDHN